MTHNKLVRDKIPEIIIANGDIPETRILGKDEFDKELRRKLLEEAAEAATSNDTTELADVLEVVYALAAQAGLSREELDTMRALKCQERGAFNGRVFLIETKEA